jgi:predicted dehydrogenase
MILNFRKPVTIAVLGLGNRGSIYSEFSKEHPDLCKVVAIAEPRNAVREHYAKYFEVDAGLVFPDWKDLAKLDRVADAVVITTQDRMHAEPAIAFANKGYHILLEKPMSVNEEECKAITAAVEANHCIFAVGHVMRYTPYSTQIKKVIDSGVLGRVINIQHLEPVGYFHFAHSYVRGNWRNEEVATFSLMAKSCHDVDWLRWMVGSKCTRVTSFGSLAHFTEKSKPSGASDRCVTCPQEIERQCPYSAIKIYKESFMDGNRKFPVKNIMPNPVEFTLEEVVHEITAGPYGRCVYSCDNDVVDNQVVNMEFENGVTVSFTMIAFSEEVCVRKTRIFGTHGQLEGDGHSIAVTDFRTGHKEHYHPRPDVQTKLTGHECGDYYLMKSFVLAVSHDDPSFILSGPRETLESHLIVFEAEKSRHKQQVLNLDW